jgi:hypothetical protein
MKEDDFFNNLGFDSNPFESTNADDEDRLDKYFIRPKYFDSVWGNPQHPTSAIVFAPRGGGKTAQRKMIEFESQINNNVLCVNYSRFEFSKSIQSITLNDHLRKIIQIIVIGILTKLNEEPELKSHLDSNDEIYLKKMINEYLGKISEQDFKNAIDALSNYTDKAKEFWYNHIEKINVGIDVLVLKFGLNIESPKHHTVSDTIAKSHKYQIERIRNIVYNNRK